MREMKDSGIGWVHDIPITWNTIKGKYIFKNKKQVVGANVDNFERLALTLNGVIKRSKDDNEGLQPDKFNTYQILRKNELVFKLIDLQNISTSRVGLSQYTGIVSPAYIILKANKGIHPAFAEKYYLMMWMNQVFNALGDSGVRSSLNSNELLEISAPLPTIEEQKLIAEFLDKKCGEIDGLISNIEKEIEVLIQYKKSIITETVTKGFNKDIKLKSSKISWIPEIPDYWEVSKIKYNLSRKTVRNPGNATVLSLYREYGIVPKDSRDDNHNVTSEDTSKYLFVKKGQFVINKMKAWQGSMAISKYEGIVSPAYYVYDFISNNLCKEYLHYLLKNPSYIEEFRRLSGGIREGQWDLPAEEFENLLILIPPIQEQREIAEYLDKKCKEIDSILEDKNKQLEILESYKKSIIYEYVTGKKEVVDD